MLKSKREKHENADSSVVLGASQRNTTRTEDLAYCLMGLFEVNMPLLYGEGSKSFFRLQEQIIQHSDDESIFAWDSTSDSSTSFLAASPRDFARSGDIVQSGDRAVAPFSLTNRGIYMQTSLFEYHIGYRLDKLLVLNCQREGNTHKIYVYVKGNSQKQNFFRRGKLRAISEFAHVRLKTESVYIHIDRNTSSGMEIRTKCFVQTRGLRENGIRIEKIDSSIVSVAKRSSMVLWDWIPTDRFVGGLRFCNAAGDGFDIILRTARSGNAVTAMINGPIRDSSEGPIFTTNGNIHFPPVESSDRLRWHDSSKKMWVDVTIRPQHISESEYEDEDETGNSGHTYKVDIQWYKPGDSRVYEPINLKELAISTGLQEDLQTIECFKKSIWRRK